MRILPNVEWEVAQDLVTPGGTILFNQIDGATHRCYAIQPTNYKIVPTLRVTQDNVSQQDGTIPHPRWKTGLVATFVVQYQIRQATSGPAAAEFKWACASDLRVMHENLTKALNSIRKETGNTQRFLWTPSGYGDRRMLDFVQCLAWTDPSYLEPGTQVAFSLETPLPYAIDMTETTSALPATVNNVGTSTMFPVFKVHGPFSTFTLMNVSNTDEFGNPIQIVYDASLPGAQVVASGHYAEIDTFRGTIFLDGNGADLTAGIDPSQSDFSLGVDGWLLPGSNICSCTVATDMLWNNAWS